MWPIHAFKLYFIAYCCRYITSPSQATIQSIPKALEVGDVIPTEETKLNNNTVIQHKVIDTFHTEETKPNNAVIKHKNIKTIQTEGTKPNNGAVIIPKEIETFYEKELSYFTMQVWAKGYIL